MPPNVNIPSETPIPLEQSPLVLSFLTISFFIKELTENHCHSYHHAQEYVSRARAYYKAIADVLTVPVSKKLLLYYFFKGLPIDYSPYIRTLIELLDKQQESEVDLEFYLHSIELYTYAIYYSYSENGEEYGEEDKVQEEHEFLCKG